MSGKTYHSDAGKGSHRRKEDKQKFEKNFDGIDWSAKSTTCPKPVEEEAGCGASSDGQEAIEG